MKLITLNNICTITQLSLLILGLVFILIAIRQIGRFHFRIWQVMLAGALAVLVTGQISPDTAIKAINPGVITFLLSMFIIGAGFESSGLLKVSINWITNHARSGDQLLALIIVVMGFLSAILMNDTIAIIGGPLVLVLADRFNISKSGALLALCFAITTGSVFSPIGNPQNYLITTYVADMSPYLLFFSGLFIPTILSLGIVWIVLRPLFKSAGQISSQHEIIEPTDNSFRKVIYFSIFLLFLGVGMKIVYGLTGIGLSIPFEWIAVSAAIPVILFTPDRMAILKKTDWCTLIFFAAMFVLMQSVYDTGLFLDIVHHEGEGDIIGILTAGILLSQVISNVPFVALFQPVLLSPGVSPSLVLALAAGSTIAGNLTILGAASNVIIIQQAEREGIHISMRFFCRYGIPVTLVQTGIYASFLMVFPM